MSIHFSEKHRQNRNLPSLFSGVYTEYIGDKSVPRALKERQCIFIFGPSGVGKTMVAKHLFAEQFVLFNQQDLQDAFYEKIRHFHWPKALSTENNVILEAPCYLGQRPQILKMLRSLIQLRYKKGLRTIILDAEDMSPVRDILQTLPSEERASIILRFPSGRGKYRFLAHECRKRNLPVKLARKLSKIEPWNYAIVFQALEAEEAKLENTK